MKYLAIDYGRKHVGLARSEGEIAAPAGTMDNNEKIWEKLAAKIIEEGVTTVVIGISEGQAKAEAAAFGGRLSNLTKAQVVYYDETLSSQTAKKKMIEAGKPRHRRQKEDHCVAAALILQNYLNEKGGSHD